MTDTPKPLSAEEIPLMLHQLLRSDYAEAVIAHIADLDARLESARQCHLGALNEAVAFKARAEKAKAALSTERAAGYRAGMVRAAEILRCLGLSYSAKFILAESEKPEGKEG